MSPLQHIIQTLETTISNIKTVGWTHGRRLGNPEENGLTANDIFDTFRPWLEEAETALSNAKALGACGEWQSIKTAPAVENLRPGMFVQLTDDDRAWLSRQSYSPWQPIETAPRDGTRVLLWTGSWSSIGSVHSEGFWWDEDGECDPTHWMPLPEPPSSTGAA